MEDYDVQEWMSKSLLKKKKIMLAKPNKECRGHTAFSTIHLLSPPIELRGIAQHVSRT